MSKLEPAPHPTFRLIPSRFPPIGLFDTVSTAADMEAVMELVGWTNDRLVADRIARLPVSERVYGRANSSIVMAAFLHAQPGGARFNAGELGAWYASATLATAAAEVGHHLRREAVSRSLSKISRTYRAYAARLEGEFVQICGKQKEMSEVYASDSYAASQAFGESVRQSEADGILYDSVRLAGGVNIVAFRPSKILDILQTDHFEVTVWSDRRTIDLRRINGGE